MLSKKKQTDEEADHVHALPSKASKVASKASKVADIPVVDMRSQIAHLLKFSTYEVPQRYWLDTGSPDLNAALGSRKRGLPYGKMYELFGPNHGGKTTLTTVLAGRAQKDGAAIGYIDLEDSRDPVWAAKLGLKFDNVYTIWPKMLQDKKTGKAKRFMGAEEMFAEAELAMQKLADMGFEKQFWMLDSIANLRTMMAVEAGTMGRNMRVNNDRALFLSNTLPDWAAKAVNYNAMIVFINQVRTKPGVVYGNPEYTPGGSATLHNCSLRARIRRFKNGQLKKNGTVVGIVAKVTNVKNKAGGGSSEGRTAAFEIRWDTNPAKVAFMPEDEVEI